MAEEACFIRNLYMPSNDHLGMAACTPQFQVFYMLHVRYMVKVHAFRSDDTADEQPRGMASYSHAARIRYVCERSGVIRFCKVPYNHRKVLYLVPCGRLQIVCRRVMAFYTGYKVVCGYLPCIIVRDHNVAAFAEGRTFTIFHKTEKNDKRYE